MLELVIFAIGAFVAGTSQPTKKAGGRGADLDALASMLIAETNFVRQKDEMAQIIYVAINRAKKHGITIAAVVDPARRAFPAWNTNWKYRDRYRDATLNQRWASARQFALSVVNGSYRNAKKTAFAHPEALSVPPCGAGQVTIDTFAGPRCIGASHPVATASTVLRVGGALFA